MSLRRYGLSSYRLGLALFGAERYERSLEHSARAAGILDGFDQLHALAVHARLLHGAALFRLGRYEESVAVCDQVVAVRDSVPELLERLDPELRDLRLADFVADAWWVKTEALERLGRLEEADMAASGLIEAFDLGETPQQRWVVAGTFRRRGILARVRGDLDGALGFLQEALLRSPASESEDFAHAHCMALLERGEVLEQAARDDEAVAAYDELVRRFRTVDEPDVQEAVADALRLKSNLASRASGHS